MVDLAVAARLEFSACAVVYASNATLYNHQQTITSRTKLAIVSYYLSYLATNLIAFSLLTRSHLASGRAVQQRAKNSQPPRSLVTMLIKLNGHKYTHMTLSSSRGGSENSLLKMWRLLHALEPTPPAESPPLFLGSVASSSLGVDTDHNKWPIMRSISCCRLDTTRLGTTMLVALETDERGRTRRVGVAKRDCQRTRE